MRQKFILQEWSKMGQGTPKDTFLFILDSEHKGILRRLDQLYAMVLHLSFESRMIWKQKIPRIREHLNFFTGHFLPHMAMDDHILFPFVRRHIPRLEATIHFLESDHKEIRVNLETFIFLFDEFVDEKKLTRKLAILESLKEKGTYFVCLMRSHIEEETENFYRILDRELRPEEKRFLSRKLKASSCAFSKVPALSSPRK